MGKYYPVPLKDRLNAFTSITTIIVIVLVFTMIVFFYSQNLWKPGTLTYLELAKLLKANPSSEYFPFLYTVFTKKLKKLN